MNTSDFSITLLADRTPAEVFKAINNVRGWWTEEIEGGTDKLNDEFTVRFGDVHFSRHKLIEIIPGRKIVWLVTDSNLSWIKDKQEWTNTRISFEISDADGKTRIHFTHIGLVPAIECYTDCSSAWSQYINQSLLSLIDKGKGYPDLKPVKARSSKTSKVSHR